MYKLSNQYILKVIAGLLVQLLLFSGSVIAASINQAYLSPSVNVDAGDFNKSFNQYFNEQTAVLSKLDTTQTR
ncbi:MAG: hypothetical protein KAR20_25155, partial [Candidatus Heimdallarchaeota archaeon]|nr:hypothetical protein [Candidatus Heimdallarchaeota archaeon]